MTIRDQSAPVIAGDSATLTVALTDRNGDPLKVPGARARWRLGREPGGPALLEKLSDGEDPKVSLSEGRAVVTIDPGETAGMEGVYQQSVVVIDRFGNVAHTTVGVVPIAPALAAPVAGGAP